MIAYCQNSSYGELVFLFACLYTMCCLLHCLSVCLDDLVLEPHIHKYLTHIRYIDELQAFFMEENFK